MKPKQNTPSELKGIIEKYRREMLESYQKKSLPDDITSPVTETSIPEQPSFSYTCPDIEDLPVQKVQPAPQFPPAAYDFEDECSPSPSMLRPCINQEAAALKPEPDVMPATNIYNAPVEDECSPSPSMFRPINQLKKEVLASMPASPSSPAMLQVNVMSGRPAAPVVGARVLVTRVGASGQKVHKSIRTDDNGSTPIITMPTCEPPAPCTIEVNANGYCGARYSGIPLYGGLTAIQQIDLIPLPAGQKSELLILFDETPSQK
ncbi:MAG: hypothetical protein PHH84_00500 [Oscillospiraceae bacterium]|nr:hypothetical protein [Oscillospiraceae bacterium]MDD4413051.1 hypothetical protein [Oscillospiraceae bacterium]